MELTMNPLRRSLQSSIHNHRPPESDPEFEDICLDLFELILKNHDIKIYNKIGPAYITYKGSKGDKQYGFDIKCKSSLAVAQCKLVDDLFPSDLQKELKKLLEYKGIVSHYFFLISNDRVKSSLQDWVDEKNSETEVKINEDKRFPVEPADRLPWFHIIGWTEIKNYILESTLLTLKWGVLEGLTTKYPYLHGLNTDKLKLAIKNIALTSEIPPCSKAISGYDSLTNSLNPGEILKLGFESKIDFNTLKGISNFIQLYDETYNISQTYSNTLKKLDSEDTIIFEEGLDQLNTISRYSARIYALQYLRKAYLAARALNNILFIDEDYSYPETFTQNYEDGFEEIPTGYLLFNFSNPTEVNSPWYIDPTTVQQSASILATELQNFTFSSSFEAPTELLDFK
jgi:hypothetical protein